MAASTSPQKESPYQKKQTSYKILVIGDPGAGKSSIIRRFVHNVFTANYKATIGVDFALKILALDEQNLVHLQIWDISGQDRYGVMTRVYYKDAHAAIVVLDATRQRTTEGALRWKADLDAKVTLADGSPVPAVLLANKCDMENELTDEELENLEEENGFIASFRTSAKDNFGIDEAFRCVANKVLNTEKGGQYEVPFSNRDGNIRLSQASALHKTQSASCCF